MSLLRDHSLRDVSELFDDMEFAPQERLANIRVYSNKEASIPSEMSTPQLLRLLSFLQNCKRARALHVDDNPNEYDKNAVLP